MVDTATTYPIYNHDTDGHAAPDVEPGRLFFDKEKGKIVCSMHGDKCATDGTDIRGVHEAPYELNPDTGLHEQSYDKLKKLGDARLYRCTVCGQGTWSHEA